MRKNLVSEHKSIWRIYMPNIIIIILIIMLWIRSIDFKSFSLSLYITNYILHCFNWKQTKLQYNSGKFKQRQNQNIWCFISFSFSSYIFPNLYITYLKTKAAAYFISFVLVLVLMIIDNNRHSSIIKKKRENFSFYY